MRDGIAQPGAGSDTAEHIRRRISPEIPVFCQNLLKKANGCAIIQLWSRRISTLPAHTETANSGVQPNGPDLAGLHTVNAHYMQQQAAPLFYCTTFANVLQEEGRQKLRFRLVPSSLLYGIHGMWMVSHAVFCCFRSGVEAPGIGKVSEACSGNRAARPRGFRHLSG